LGLIHVADIEEVGTGPLMEELGMDEALAARVVEICSEVAKVVAVEQAAKKEAEAKAKASSAQESKRALDALLGLNHASANPEGESSSEASASASDEAATELPGALQATEGSAPEVTVHKSTTVVDGDELSVEEQAISGLETADLGSTDKPLEDENEDVAALAEGRESPPGKTGDEPK
jgi:hypothetical protein